MAEDTFRLVEWWVTNVKRVRVMHIRPKGPILEITGRNDQGKSSAIDSIMYALGGTKSIPKRPIRDGAKRAEVVVNLDAVTVTRKWTADSTSYLTVESKNGAVHKSPQALLADLFDDLDPHAFVRMDEKGRTALLKRIAGLDFDELDARRVKLYEERTIVNRDAKQAEAELKGMGSQPPDVPDEEVSFATLTNLLSEAIKLRDSNAAVRKEYAECCALADSRKQGVVDAERQLGLLRIALDKANKDVAVYEASVPTLIDPDVDAFQADLTDAESSNREVRAKQQRKIVATRLRGLKADSEKKTAGIESVDTDKARMLRDAKMPVDSLGIDEDGVTLNGLPFTQASSSEQLRTSIAMGLALNPKLKLLFVRDGSLLDSESRKVMEEMAKEHDALIIIERVTDGEPVGVVIEDGMASGAEALPVEVVT